MKQWRKSNTTRKFKITGNNFFLLRYLFAFCLDVQWDKRRRKKWREEKVGILWRSIFQKRVCVIVIVYPHLYPARRQQPTATMAFRAQHTPIIVRLCGFIPVRMNENQLCTLCSSSWIICECFSMDKWWNAIELSDLNACAIVDIVIQWWRPSNCCDPNQWLFNNYLRDEFVAAFPRMLLFHIFHVGTKWQKHENCVGIREP